jgi:signal transduction histidine kinase
MGNKIIHMGEIGSGQLTKLINQLLFNINVAALADRALQRLSVFADHNEVALVDAVPADLPFVIGDEDRLVQLLVNLVHNAVKFSPQGGTVTMRGARAGDEVTLAVEDHGIGIPRADQSRVFERFYKVDRARVRGVGGTGLGLTIARHIAESHGGRIWVESEEGRGSTFSVALPIAGPGTGAGDGARAGSGAGADPENGA